MKIAMTTCEEKRALCSNFPTTKNEIRIAVFGQHDVGKSALTVRYLTRRFIGEYKSNTDMLYRQTMNANHGKSLDIEILDISTPESSKSFPVEEIHRSDGFIIVYSITDKSSFTFALEALSDISAYYNNSENFSPFPVALIGNKADLEHLRSVDKTEGLVASLKYGATFYELSVAENSPEVYKSFQTTIKSLMGSSQQTIRKFSVSKLFGNLRLGRSNPSNGLVAKAPASIVDTDVTTSLSCTNSPAKFTDSSIIRRDKHQRSKSSSDGCNNFRNSICNLKSKIGDLHLINKRQHSPPICSL